MGRFKFLMRFQISMNQGEDRFRDVREPDWSTVLRKLYNRNAILSKADTKNGAINDAAEIIAADSDMKTLDVVRNLDHLAHIGLVQIEQREVNAIKIEQTLEKSDTLPNFGIWLTREGFKIAHEREMDNRQEEREDGRIEQQNEVNRAIGLLTLGLVFISLMDSMIQVEIQSNIPNLTPLGLALVSAAVVFGMALELLRSGVLTNRS